MNAISFGVWTEIQGIFRHAEQFFLLYGLHFEKVVFSFEDDGLGDIHFFLQSLVLFVRAAHCRRPVAGNWLVLSRRKMVLKDIVDIEKFLRVRARGNGRKRVLN